jgi:hypothetical protein
MKDDVQKIEKDVNDLVDEAVAFARPHPSRRCQSCSPTSSGALRWR